MPLAARRLKKPPKVSKVDPAPRLRGALAKRTKAELIDILIEFTLDDRQLLRRLDARFKLEAPPQELVAATRRATADATDFDDRDTNRNFSYDYEAYNEVQRNLRRLVKLGQLRPAMELSFGLMEDGSHQVEMSGEGLMSDDIEDCLRGVIAAVKKSDLPGSEIVAWCEEMINRDSVGCLCDQELESLRRRRAPSK